MASDLLTIDVEGAADAVVLTVANSGEQPAAVPNDPVVGVRARSEDGSWRAACRCDPMPAPPVELPPGGAHRVRVDWPTLLRTDAPPPPGVYLVTLAVAVGDEVRFTPPTRSARACP